MHTLFIVGLGPGSMDLLTPRAQEALAASQVIVGYSTYIDLLPASLLQGKEVISTGMTKEMARCELALRHAANGQTVSLVCSGDPGIYALAGLALEMSAQLASEPALPAKKGIIASARPVTYCGLEIEIIPGVPALCAASALLGAPLGHDFACLSLSDRLTAPDLIEKRVRLALEADLALVLHNPRSRQRPDFLGKILNGAVLNGHGNLLTGVVRNASRPQQSVNICTLSELVRSGLEAIDMFTLIIVGSSSTRLVSGKMVTPRGYLEKYSLQTVRAKQF